MTARPHLRALRLAAVAAALLAAAPVAADELAELRAQLEAQRALIREQQAMLAHQQLLIEEQARRTAELEVRLQGLERARTAPLPRPAPPVAELPPLAPQPAVPPPAMTAMQEQMQRERDAIGDMNTMGVTEGRFPGSVVIPGPAATALAIGGFVKTVGIYDTSAEAQGAVFLPALLGTQRDDDDGNFSIDVTLSRVNLDLRGPSPLGPLRGYLEMDFNGRNNGTADPRLRHLFSTWETGDGTLTAGQTWSTFMDLKALPEGLTEPAVSGIAFQRQPLARWSLPLGAHGLIEASAEDPDSSDVFDIDNRPTRSAYPDLIAAAEYGWPGVGHLRLGGVLRWLELDEDDDHGSTERGYGLTMGAHLDSVGRDRLIFSATWGKGLARYLVGLSPDASGTSDPSTGNLELRRNYGGFLGYQRFWTDTLRSSLALGLAHADAKPSQDGGTFVESRYLLANLLWSVLPYLTFGVEYDYGVRDNKDGSDKGDQRLMLGMQLF